MLGILLSLVLGNNVQRPQTEHLGTRLRTIMTPNQVMDAPCPDFIDL